jgi:hypothetical protein
MGPSSPPDEVVVVLHTEDAGGRAVVSGSGLTVTEVLVDRPGQVAALNAGLAAVTADIAAITDDDAAPFPDWVARLLGHFADEAVAAVGGRDVVVWDGAVIGLEDGFRRVVGRVGWYGRIAGNHHRGIGPARCVDALKGANMAFRTERLRAVGFDLRLRGVGAQVHNDLMVCLTICRAVGRLLYDPAVQVFHYPAPRTAGDAADDRTPADLRALSDEVHNETLALLEFLPFWRRALWIVWAVGCGTRRAPGLGASLVLIPQLGWSAVARFLACARGRLEGLLTWRASRR